MKNMTNDELMRLYKPKNTPREPSKDEINSILNSGIEDPIEYILTHFYDKGGENCKALFLSYL